MELNQKNIDISEKIVNKNEHFIHCKKIESRNYLYPNGHRITHQMRWFKGSRDRGLRSDMVA